MKVIGDKGKYCTVILWTERLPGLWKFSWDPVKQVSALIKYEAGRTERTKTWGSLSFRSEYRKHPMWPLSEKWAGRLCMKSLLGHSGVWTSILTLMSLRKATSHSSLHHFSVKWGYRRVGRHQLRRSWVFKTPCLWLIQSLNELKHRSGQLSYKTFIEVLCCFPIGLAHYLKIIYCVYPRLCKIV